MKMCSIASGSSGNCIYIANEDTHILVDVGISKKRIVEGLKGIGVDASEIDAILITHEHSDHISGLGVSIWYSYLRNKGNTRCCSTLQASWCY